MDKSDEFFEVNYGEPIDPAVQNILARLRNMAACFRNAFPETQLLLNQTGNATAWDSVAGGSDGEPSGDSILHTVVILSVFCLVVLLLVVRSSRGGSWTSCRVDAAAVAAQNRAAKDAMKKLNAIPARVPSWTGYEYDRPSFSSTLRVEEINETNF
ncbi:hypothetical protein BV898_14043 [Hypsibius exemplaris]|uniref:Uncharacterized protein n=1 Tax=Hypsibius exemplaris TaxID=2072580 RepID=A0A1W0W8X1_HYPEX|nr:hypothetical protein BV898_14043 [Hypsibius exemplaris]